MLPGKQRCRVTSMWPTSIPNSKAFVAAIPQSFPPKNLFQCSSYPAPLNGKQQNQTTTNVGKYQTGLASNSIQRKQEHDVYTRMMKIQKYT